jgi:uncharacterized membrane protein
MERIASNFKPILSTVFSWVATIGGVEMGVHQGTVEQVAYIMPLLQGAAFLSSIILSWFTVYKILRKDLKKQ